MNFTKIKNSEFSKSIFIDRISSGILLHGQVPWKISDDVNGTVHLIYPNIEGGKTYLMYRTVDSTGAVSKTTVVSENMVIGLPGMNQNSIGADICGRPTVVYLEKIKSADSKSESNFVLKVKQGV